LYDSKNNKINYCNIYNNKEYGLFNNEQYEMYYTVDATNNWWGSADGCSGAGSGSGDKVITYILSGTQDNDAIIYDPWLTSKDGVTVTDGGDTTDGSEEGVKEEKGKQVCGVIYLPLIIVGICMIVLRDRRKQRF